MNQALELLEANAIRARRRPRAILVLWLWELLAGFLVAAPIHAWARHAWGSHPDGDLVLFRPRGHALLSWLGDDGPGLAIVFRTSLLLLLVFAVLGHLVTGVLLASLSVEDAVRKTPPLRFALRVGAAAFVPLTGIGVLVTASEGVFLGVGLLAAGGIDHGLTPRLGDQRAFLVHLAPVVIGALLAALAGVVGDLARADVARGVARDQIAGEEGASAATRMRDSALVALRSFRREPAAIFASWGWRAALAVLLLALGARLGDLAGGRTGFVLLAVFGGHQVIVLLRATLRTSWLANALRSISVVSCTPARTDGPPAPILDRGA